MKKNTLFLCLLAGSFLCFSNTAFAQYHTGGSTGDYGGASKAGLDDPFTEGDKFIELGVGFLGSGVDQVLGSVATSKSEGVGIDFNSEKAVSDHIGIGEGFTYQHATVVNTYSILYNNGYYGNSLYTETDSYSITFLQAHLRVAYHFSAGDKLDPYAGVGVGYCILFIPVTSTSNQPGFESTGTYGGGGFLYGGFAGARYFFSDNVGAWFELQYFRTNPSVSGNSSYGGSYSNSIVATSLLNLGICFKW